MIYTEESIIKHVENHKASKKKTQTFWDYYSNDVARSPYFPKGEKEELGDYNKRLKLAIGWPGKIVDRVNSYFRKPPITVIFTENGESGTANAKLAAEVWAAMTKTNLGRVPHNACRDAGVSGYGHTKQSIEFYDRETGEVLETIAGDKVFAGQVKATRVNDTFVYWLADKYGDTYIEAWARRGDEYKQISDIAGDDKDEWTTYIEVIQPAAYDPRYSDEAGKPNKIRDARHLIIKNGEISFDEPIEYYRIPAQRWVNSIDKSITQGTSDISKAINISQAINLIVSGCTRAIDYHGWPKMLGLGVDDNTEIRMTTDGMAVIPPNSAGENPEIELLTWDQDITGALDLTKYLEDAMCSIENIPRDLLHSLDGVGNVPSAVALRTMYAPLNDRCTAKEVGIGTAEASYIKSCLDVLATHNQFSGFDNIEVTLQYNPDRTPRDLALEIAEVDSLRVAGAATAVDSYLAAHPEVSTREAALTVITDVIIPEKVAIRDAIRQSGTGKEFASYIKIAYEKMLSENKAREVAGKTTEGGKS